MKMKLGEMGQGHKGAHYLYNFYTLIKEKKKLGDSASCLYTNLATWDAEIGKIMVRGQPEQIVCQTPSPK
jgi:hypothetical protein